MSGPLPDTAEVSILVTSSLALANVSHLTVAPVWVLNWFAMSCCQAAYSFGNCVFAETNTSMVLPAPLVPPEPEVRTIARRLYEAVSELPIISPHGHVDPQILVDDAPFADPASLFVQPDHYVTRLLHAGGVSLDQLGVGEGPLPENRARQVWRLLCANWHLLRGTPVRYWFDSELGEIFGIRQRPSGDNADALYDRIAEQLAAPDHLPRALLRRFQIEVMATTDDPADDLEAHRRLAEDPEIATRVVPTFRPDAYLEPAAAGWADAVKRLGEAAGTDVGDYARYVAALEARRRVFVGRGGGAAGHRPFG